MDFMNTETARRNPESPPPKPEIVQPPPEEATEPKPAAHDETQPLSGQPEPRNGSSAAEAVGTSTAEAGDLADALRRIELAPPHREMAPRPSRSPPPMELGPFDPPHPEMAPQHRPEPSHRPEHVDPPHPAMGPQQPRRELPQPQPFYRPPPGYLAAQFMATLRQMLDQPSHVSAFFNPPSSSLYMPRPMSPPLTPPTESPPPVVERPQPLPIGHEREVARAQAMMHRMV